VLTVQKIDDNIEVPMSRMQDEEEEVETIVGVIVVTLMEGSTET
jgi:hypothetical protein